MDTYLFEFCGNHSFWNKTTLLQDRPVLTSCFLDTFPVWISCGFLWIASLPFIVFMRKRSTKPLPFSYIHIIKIALCIALICMAELHFSFRLLYGPMCEGMEIVPMSAQVAMGVRIGTFLLATVLMQVQKHCGIRTSGVLFAYWILLVTAETFRFYSYLIAKIDCPTHVVFYVYYATIFLQLVAHCFSIKAGILSTGKVQCPQDHGSILNRITYTWMTSLVYSVFKRRFKREAMWKQTAGLQSSVIGPQLEIRWNNELKKKRKKSEGDNAINIIVEPFEDLSNSHSFENTPLLSTKEIHGQKQSTERCQANLVKVVLMENWFGCLEYLFYSWFSVMAYCLLPVILGYLIDFIDTKSTSVSYLWMGILYCFIVTIAIEGSSIFYNTQCHHTATLGLKIKHSLMYLIYKKALTVSKAENKISVGDVVNYMSVDCQRIQDSIFYSYYLPNSIIYITVASYLLYTIVGGPATIGGMCLLLMSVPLNVFIVRVQKRLQEELLQIKGHRVRLMNEILSGIKVLKMYAWEYTFIRKIHDIRTKEVECLKKNATLMAISTSVANHSHYVIHFMLILVYVLTTPDRYISSSIVFVSMSVVLIIKGPLLILPTLLNTLVQIIVLESSNRVGGWMKTLNTAEGAKMEMGPRSIRPVGASGLNTLSLAEELGLSDDVIPVLRSSPAAKNRFIYANDRLNIMPNGLFSLLRKLPPFSKPLIMYAYNDFKTPGNSKEDESVYSFVSRRFGEDLAKYAVDPMCRGIFAGDCRNLSVKSCFPILHTSERKHGSVLKGVSRAVSGKKATQEKLSNLAVRRTNEKWASYSFKQGLQQLSDSLRDAAKQNPAVEIVMNSPCSNLSFSDGRAMMTVNGDSIKADQVISSIYAQNLAGMLPGDHSSLIESLNSIPAVDAVVVCMEFEGKIKQAPGFGHLTPSFENSCVLGVIYDSCTFPQHDRPDKPSTRFTVMMGGSWIEDLKKIVPSMSKEDLGKFAVKSIQSQLRITQEPVNIHVELQKSCIPQYVLGHEKVLDNIFSQIKNDKLPISLVGSSYKGPSVNDCIYNARLEMERITGESLQD